MKQHDELFCTAKNNNANDTGSLVYLSYKWPCCSYVKNKVDSLNFCIFWKKYEFYMFFVLFQIMLGPSKYQRKHK